MNAPAGDLAGSVDGSAKSGALENPVARWFKNSIEVTYLTVVFIGDDKGQT